MSACITNIRIKEGILQYTVDGCHYVSVGQVGGSDGQDGQNGQNGQNGVTPHINPDNKHWMIGDIDTGIVAEGIDGSTVSIDQNGYWVIDGNTTQYKATGDVYNIDAVHGEETGTGVPSVTPIIDPTTKTATFTFSNLKGDKGDTPVFTAKKTDIGYDLYVDNKFLCTLENGQGIQGLQGEQGLQGPAGTGITWKANAVSCTNPNDGYIDTKGDLYVLTSATGVTPKEFVKYGGLRGPQGPIGQQGSMWYLKDSFETISNSTYLDFNIIDAKVGDLVIYSGASNYKANHGDVFKLDSISNDTQYWLYQNFNIKNTESSDSDEDFESLITKLRGYPLYSQSDGIDIVPNDSGYYSIKALVDNSTIKFDSEGRMYATGIGTSVDTNSDTVVISYSNTGTSLEKGIKLNSILERFFGINELITKEFVIPKDVVDIGISKIQAKSILEGHTKNIIIKVSGENNFLGREVLNTFIPATIIYNNISYPSDSCLIFGIGYKSQPWRVIAEGEKVYQQKGTNMIGLSPILYCINLMYIGNQDKYQFCGFIISTAGEFGLFGNASAKT